MNTNASVFYGENQFSLCEIPIPQVKEDGILIQVNAAGICGSDLHIRTEKPPFPVVLGHEVTGCHSTPLSPAADAAAAWSLEMGPTPYVTSPLAMGTGFHTRVPGIILGWKEFRP